MNFLGQRSYLYAGDVPPGPLYRGAVGVSKNREDAIHIKHDLTVLPLPFKDNSVELFQAEDVFEHIEFEALGPLIEDIYRILKKRGTFRLSVPDYRSDILLARVQRDSTGSIVFDPGGRGYLTEHGVMGGGHVWFPVFESVKELFRDSPFSEVEFLHYYDEDGTPHIRNIDYAKGFVKRTPDHDVRVQTPARPLSLVVDAIK